MASPFSRVLTIAENEIGVQEWPGKEHNPRILEYHATTTLGDWGRSRDEVPWCSSFVNWCFWRAGIEGTDNALAISWRYWHTQVKPIEDFQPGDVMVLKRKKRKRGGYHVGFPYGVDARHVALLGGNQDDMVQMSVYSRRKWDIIAVRRA